MAIGPAGGQYSPDLPGDSYPPIPVWPPEQTGLEQVHSASFFDGGGVKWRHLFRAKLWHFFCESFLWALAKIVFVLLENS